jgi:hypothetical protein
MFYAISWFFVALLLALWSLAAWALHTVAVWTVSVGGAVTGAATSGISVALPDGLAAWVPPEVAEWVSLGMAGLRPAFDSLLQLAPALSGGLTVATWVIWAIGSLLLVLLGAGLHLLIALWRRYGGTGSGPSAAPSAAAG